MIGERELDAKVAEKIMGWKWNEESAWTPSRGHYSRTDTQDSWWWLPYFSSNVDDGFQVLEQLKHLEPEIVWNDEAHCWFVSFHKKDGATGSSVSAPHAICLAALRAVE